MPMAKPGITKSGDLSSIELPPGMGDGQPIAGSPHRYCGTLTFGPGDAFNFHRHPSQNEVIYVVEGTMEGWVEKDRAILEPGDVMVAPAGIVHACFNTSKHALKLFVVLDPLLPNVEEDMEMLDGYGWEMVDVSGEEPWASLR